MKHPRRMLRRMIIAAVTFPLALLRADAVDDYVKAEMKTLRIPGLSLAVVQNSQLMKAAGYGLSNVETATPATPETAYKVASISKPIIATAVMLLAQQGRLSLNDTVARYLPDSPSSWADITIHQVLSHTSGLVRDPPDYRPYVEQQPMTVIELAYSLPLQSKPGTRWSYSNVGYYVLAEIITRVAGIPWNDFIAKQLFEPAGMASTRLTSVSAIIPNRARGYEIGPAGLENAQDWIAVRPSGAFVSTVLDLAKLDVYLDSHSPLDAAGQTAMITPTKLLDGNTAPYGLGWNVDSYLEQERVSHDGQYPGFRSEWERYPRQKLSIIVIGNLGSAPVQRLVPKIAGFYSPELVAPEFSASAETPANSLSAGKPGMITVVVRSVSRSAPDSVFELEIWDQSNKAVDKQSRTAKNLSKGQSKTLEFTWTPMKAGKYTLNLGIYGPKWNPSYFWSQGMATITVD